MTLYHCYQVVLCFVNNLRATSDDYKVMSKEEWRTQREQLFVEKLQLKTVIAVI